MSVFYKPQYKQQLENCFNQNSFFYKYFQENLILCNSCKSHLVTSYEIEWEKMNVKYECNNCGCWSIFEFVIDSDNMLKIEIDFGCWNEDNRDWYLEMDCPICLEHRTLREFSWTEISYGDNDGVGIICKCNFCEIKFRAGFINRPGSSHRRIDILEGQIYKKFESPIEEKLYRYLAMTKKCNLLKIETQKKIGDYRVDFFITPIIYSNNKEVIIECDGHQFHEKTKEQATKDRQRDRDLKILGYDVLRFTGSEIYKDPFKCTDEIYKFLGV